MAGWLQVDELQDLANTHCPAPAHCHPSTPRDYPVGGGWWAAGAAGGAIKVQRWARKQHPGQYSSSAGRRRKIIAFRNVGQGKRCRICASLDQERSQTTSQAETADVIHRKKHLMKVKRDRQLDVRTSFTAQQNAKHLNADGEGQVLKLSIDGMDQATPCQGFCKFWFQLYPNIFRAGHSQQL